MAAFPITDAYYLQQQQQEQQPPAAAATVAQAKSSGATAAVATSIYERQYPPAPPLLQQQPMLLQSLVLTTAADLSYGQQHQHPQQQQQQQPSGAGGVGGRGCQSSLRSAQVNILSSGGGDFPLTSSHLLPHPQPAPSQHRPLPPQPDRRKQPPGSSSTGLSTIDTQVRMPNVVGRQPWPSKTDGLPKSVDLVEMPASAAATGASSAAAAVAAAAAAAAAALNRRPRMVGPPTATPANIPCQSPVKANSITGVEGADEINNYLAKTNHRRYQGSTVENSISLYASGARSTMVANGWSSGGAERNLLTGDDQPLDLTSVKKKRQSDDAANDDSPLDLSTKKRRLDDGFSTDGQQKPVVDGHLGFPCNRPDAALAAPTVSHEMNARLAVQRSLVDSFGPTGVFGLQSTVLIPPSVGGAGTSSKGHHRQTQNPPRPRPCNLPRLSLVPNSFAMFPGRTGTTDVGSHSSNEVPVIRSATGFQLISQSGSQSGVTSASGAAAKPDTASFIRNPATYEELGNQFVLGQITQSLLQQQQQQQLFSACSANPRDNIPKMLVTEQKTILKDFKELSKYSDLNRASAAAAQSAVLELGSHFQAAPVIASLQQQQQQQQGSFPGAKKPPFVASSCNDVNNKHKLNNNHDAPASATSTSIPMTSYGVRPNSRGSHAKPRTSRPSANCQTTGHDVSSSSSSLLPPTSANSTGRKTPRLDPSHVPGPEYQLTTPSRESYLGSGAKPKDELTWNKQPESKPPKPGMPFQAEEDATRQVLQPIQKESPKKPMLPSSDVDSVVTGRNRNYCQQGFALTETIHLTGIKPEIPKDEAAVKTEARQNELRSTDADASADLLSTPKWPDSAHNSKWSKRKAGTLFADSEKLTDLRSQSYAVLGDRVETSGGARSALQPHVQGEVIKNDETPTIVSDGPVQETSKELDFSYVKKSHQRTTGPIVSADLMPQESEEATADKDATRRVGAGGGCEACKCKESGDAPPPINNPFPKVLLSCRDCDPREMLCSGGQSQASATFAGDLIPRPCRGFDRQSNRRIPVANVQPFMKEPADAVVFKTPADPPQPNLENAQKAEDTQTQTSSTADDDTEANAKAAMVTGSLKVDNQTIGWTSGDTPHHKEFVKFLEISAANPYRTPDGKMRETLGPGANEATDCDDRGRVKRQLLLHLAGPKGRPKPTGEAKRESGSVVGCESKKTPVEYIDEDNCVEPIKEKQKASLCFSETRDPVGRNSTPENDEFVYSSSALYQTMKALDRQAEDRFKASILANTATFSVSKTDPERKAQNEDGGVTFGLNRASDRPTNDMLPEQTKKKKQKPKATHVDETTGQLEMQRTDNVTNNIAEQQTSNGQKEPPAAASTTDETAATEAGDSIVASSSALDESVSSLKPAMKRKYKRKKTKQEELPGVDDGNKTMAESAGSKSSTAFMSSSESPEVTPKKKRRRAIELLTQFNPPDETRADYGDRLSRSATDSNVSATHSISSSTLLQVPQFLQQTSMEPTAGRRRGTSTRRDGSIVRHARRCSTYDRNAAYEAELKQEAERRLVRRGRGCRAAARHQSRILSPHRRTDAEPRDETPSASYAADDGTGGDQYHHHHHQQQLHLQSQRVDDETTRDLFEYDDSSDPVLPSRRDQGRKPVRKNGRIAFQYPEVFGRRRARGGLRGRSRPVRSSSGADTTGGWDGHSPCDPMDFEMDRSRNEGVTIDDKSDPFSTQSISQPMPSTSIRGKVRSRVRVGGRGSRGHPRNHQAPRYDPVPPASDSRPCPSALGRDTSETRLHQVTRLGYEELVSYYLTTGIIHPNVQDNSGVTPLHDSCNHGYLSITRLLLDHGAHPNSKALDGTRPLHLAVANDHVEIVRLLLSYGADATMTNANGRSPLQMAKTRDMRQLLKGFASDLSGGKGKEIPWQFPASFEVSVCDVLVDAPPDDLIEATEVVFDLGTDNSLPVHRFVSDSQKGPRNFHSICDLCQDVKIEDFLLLNGDLTFVHVSTAADFPSMEAPTAEVLGHPLPGPSSSSSSSSSLPDHQHAPALFGASSSVSILQQQQQQRGCMSSSSSRQRALCSATAGADRSSYVEIDASLKGLLDVAIHRVPLYARCDVTWPPSGRFSSRRTEADDSKNFSAEEASSLISNASLRGSDSCSVSSSSSFAPVTLLTTKSELENSIDVTNATPSGAEKPATNCLTLTGTGSNGHSSSKLESKAKMPVRSASPCASSSALTRHAIPLPLVDQKVENGSSRDALEQCRIVLCDIKNPSSTDLISPIKGDVRKDIEKPTTVIHRGEEKEDRKRNECKHPVHINEQTGNTDSVPVKSTSAVIDRTTSSAMETAKDLIPSFNNIPAAASQRPSLSGLSSTVRGMAHASSGGSAAAPIPHQRISVFNHARRRAASRELVDGGVTAKPEAVQSESLIPVLEKHGSDDETPPVENEEDVCGESYDDEREMPQLTLYA